MPDFSSRSLNALRVFNVITLFSTLYVNYLANALPLNGKTTGQLSDQYPNLFTPAGLTFSVWGLIYVGLIAFAIFQALPLFSRRWVAETNPVVVQVGGLFILTNLLNATWILAWHYEQLTLSVFLMVSFLQTLLVLNERLQRGAALRTGRAFWLVRMPFGLYWGWISIATIANVTALLVALDWHGFGLPEAFWAMLLIGVGTVVAVVVLRRGGNAAYGFVVVWALAGILLKRSQAGADLHPGVSVAAVLGILAVGYALLLRARKGALTS